MYKEKKKMIQEIEVEEEEEVCHIYLFIIYKYIY